LRDGREIEIGKEYDTFFDEAGNMQAQAKICFYGFHGSIRAVDALKYAPGFWVSRRELWGEGTDYDEKLVRTHCRHVAGADAREVVSLWAVDVSEDVMKTAEVTDKRALAVPGAIRAFMDGKITKEKMMDKVATARTATRGAWAAWAAWAACAAAAIVTWGAWSAWAAAAIVTRDAWAKYNAWLEERLTALLEAKQ